MLTVLEPITESELRAFVRGRLNERARTPAVKIFDELAIERGSARVDLALVGEVLEAFELKSDLDGFGRLHNQIHAYNRVFDRITLVAGGTLVNAAVEILPKWWGVWAVRRQPSGGLSLDTVRDASDNPRQESLSLATLLWRDEAAEVLLNETGAAPSKRASRMQLCEWIAQEVELPSIRRHVARRLVSRRVDEPKVARPATAPVASAPDDGWSHHGASCWDFHFPA